MGLPLAPLAGAAAKAVVSGLGKAMGKLAELGKLFTIYRAGKKAQQHADMERTVDIAEHARRIEESVDDLSESELDDRLRRRRGDS